jgi:hypothetical protein
MIDIEGIKRELKPECVICNIDEKLWQKKRCKGCLFIKNSAPSKGKPSRVGLSMKLRKFGLTKKQCQNLGKCHLFQYLYHPELNFQPPPKPEFDRYGNRVLEGHNYNLHHKNGSNFDDRDENQEWTLPTEHPRIELENNREKRRIKKLAEDNFSSIGLLRWI